MNRDIPFRKFKVRAANNLLSWGSFVVHVWPMGPCNGRWVKENVEMDQKARDFISDAIREKLDREATQ